MGFTIGGENTNIINTATKVKKIKTVRVSGYEGTFEFDVASEVDFKDIPEKHHQTVVNYLNSYH